MAVEPPAPVVPAEPDLQPLDTGPPAVVPSPESALAEEPPPFPSEDAPLTQWLDVLSNPLTQPVDPQLQESLLRRWAGLMGEDIASERELARTLLLAPRADFVDADGNPTAETLASVERLEKLTGLEGRRPLVLRRLGELYEVYDDRKAAATWEQLIALEPDDLSVRNRWAESLSKFGQWEQSRSLAEATVAMADERGDYINGRVARYVLGSALTEAGHYVEAERVLKSALVQPDGKHWDCAYQALGVLYERLGAVDAGVDSSHPPPEPAADDDRAMIDAALRAYYAGDEAGALRWVERAIAVRSRASYGVIHGLLLVAAQRYDQARTLFVSAREAAPRAPGPRVGLAHLAIVDQDYETAGPLLRGALDQWLATELTSQEDPAYHSFIHRMACLGMAWLEANQGHHKEAIGYFDRVLAHRPFDVLARLGKSNALLGLRDLDAAEVELNGILELSPSNAFARAGLASVQLARGDLEAAEEGFRAALTGREQTYTCPYEGLGLLYLKKGQLDQARSHFERAIEINPDVEYLKYNGLAEIYLGEGRYDDAERLLRRSMANYPHDDGARVLMKRVEAARGAAAVVPGQ